MNAEPIFLFEYDVDIRWSDLDAQRHVNNATYFTYLEIVRTAWLDSLNISFGEDRTKGIVLARVEMDYLRPITFPSTLRLKMYGKEPGRSSLHSSYKILDAHDPDIVYARSVAYLVWFDSVKQSSTPMPDVVRSLFIDSAS
ncbi:MAG: thioesterase family protein [Pseudomonadota bacterium]